MDGEIYTNFEFYQFKYPKVLKFNNVERHLSIQLWSSKYLKTYSYIALQLEPVPSPHLLSENSCRTAYGKDTAQHLYAYCDHTNLILYWNMKLSHFKQQHYLCLASTVIVHILDNLPYIHTLTRIFHHH